MLHLNIYNLFLKKCFQPRVATCGGSNLIIYFELKIKNLYSLVHSGDHHIALLNSITIYYIVYSYIGISI